MTLEEKAGQLLVARVVTGADGTLWEGTAHESPFGFVPTTELISQRHITHLTLMNPTPVEDLARWGANVRALASETRLGIPLSVASDPVHGLSKNLNVSLSGGGFTQFPEPIGLAALTNPDLVYQSALVMGHELRAAGIHIALHPMADLATEPRWSRIAGTFGEDPEIVREVLSQYLKGLHEAGVSATAKHFPGGGPQAEGIDSHFAHGSETIFPGGRFATHLELFAAAVKAGVARVMPGYAIPRGQGSAPVGAAFDRHLITDILREQLGFDGVVLTDFNIVTGMRLPRLGIQLPVRAWGQLELTEVQRVAVLFDAGVDQLGGEDDPALIIEAVERGLVSEARIDESVRRVLRDKAQLGLFDDPAAGTLSPEDIRTVVGTPQHQALALNVQRASLVALQGAAAQLTANTRVYAENVDARVLSEYATVVDSVDDADLVILRLTAPFEPGSDPLAQAFHHGSLEFSEAELERVRQVIHGRRAVIDVFLDRPAVLTPFTEMDVTLIGSFGISDQALLDVISGRYPASGRLPFDLPRSMVAVEASESDVPHSSEDPLFTTGHNAVLSME